MAMRRRAPLLRQSLAVWLRTAVWLGVLGLCFALAVSAVPALADGNASTTAKGGTALSAADTLVGKLLEAGVECPQFQLEMSSTDTSSDQTGSGEVISLTGAAPQDPGTYRLTGRWSRFSYCMQGRSFDVQTYAWADAK